MRIKHLDAVTAGTIAVALHERYERRLCACGQTILDVDIGGGRVWPMCTKHGTRQSETSWTLIAIWLQSVINQSTRGMVGRQCRSIRARGWHSLSQQRASRPLAKGDHCRADKKKGDHAV